MRTPMNLTFLTTLALVAWVGCAPGNGGDAGTSDGGGDEADAGQLDAGHDAGPTTQNDSGPTGECPTISPLTNPEGQPCNEEGLVCRESGCFAPGPNCLFIECRNGEWVNQAMVDAGPQDSGPADDAGTTEDDAGATADAGDTDAN